MTAVNGYCPSCGDDWLAVRGVAVGDLMCCNPECVDPDLLARTLAKPDQHVHLVDFRETEMLVQHPLSERLDPSGVAAVCPLVAEFETLEAPPGIGMYRIERDQHLADAVEVHRDEVLFEVEPPKAPTPEERVHDMWSAIPFGVIIGVPEDTVIPEDEDRFIWVLGQRIKRADYPELEAFWKAKDIDFGNDDEHLQMPRLNDQEGAQQAILRAKP